MARLWKSNKNYTRYDPRVHNQDDIFGECGQFLPYTRQYTRLGQDKLLSLIQDARKHCWQALDLSNCGLTELPDALWDLPDLRMLYLGNGDRSNPLENHLTSLPRGIEQLKNLQVLSLRDQAIRIDAGDALNLPNLVCLDLSFTHTTQLPEAAENWTNLTNLDLSGTKITQLPEGTKNWTNLEALLLGGTKITQLPEGAENWTNLTTLDLSDTKITQLPEAAENWTNLMTLTLSATNITQLPEAAENWTSLKRLYLCVTKITQLPEAAKNWIALEKINIIGTPLWKTLPSEARALEGRDLVHYILKIQGNAPQEFFRESKLVIAGQPQVGKSSLLDRLIDDTFTPEKPSTEGIQIKPWRFEHGGEEYRLNIWDFGGQEIYHSTHQFFLTEETLYLLIWDALSEDEHGRVDYWLRTIQSLAGDSPIFIVVNKCDDAIGRIKPIYWDDYRTRYPQIEGIFEVSCKDGRNIAGLRNAIQERAVKLPLMEKKWISAWLNARTALEEKAKTTDYIPYRDFCEICRDHEVSEEDIPVLAKYLHNLGVLMYYHDDVHLKNLVILSSEWGTDAVYKILDQQERVLKGRNGILYANQDLKEIWSDRDRYPEDYHPHLLKLMEKFRLSFQVHSDTYLIAELLNIKAIERKDLSFAFGETLSFRYDYDFMPAGIMTRFIVAAHRKLDTVEGVKQCWLKGAYLRHNGAYARVVQSDTLPNRHILIQVSGGSPNEQRDLLTIIRTTLDEINKPFQKITITRRVPCICAEGCTHAFEYDYLLKAEEKGRTEVECPKSVEFIKLRKLLDGVEIPMSQREDRFFDFHNEVKVVIPNYGQTVTNNTVDNSVHLGDGNTIKNSSIGNTGEEKKEGFFEKYLWPFIFTVAGTVLAAIILYFLGLE